jgi:hypothetical protein
MVIDTSADAALASYPSDAEPLMVPLELLGHSSTLTTESGGAGGIDNKL